MSNRIKKIIFIVFSISKLYAMNVDLILKSDKAIFVTNGAWEAYSGIYVNEIEDDLYIVGGRYGSKAWKIYINNGDVSFIDDYTIYNGQIRISLNEYLINFSDTGIFINSKNNTICNLNNKIRAGISFILKKDNGYIVYYVDDSGKPGATDTNGKVYSNKEAMDFLKEYDSEKYEASLNRAEELGLYGEFVRNEVLVWGETYYSTISILENFWERDTPLYGNGSEPIQYDLQGNGYGANIRFSGIRSNVRINNSNGEQIAYIPLQESSKILSDPNVKNISFSYSWYVGFGGNIYYYIAGPEYTEVFRIRRTWGEPDFYSMAINGYTEDSYGEYVEKVLSALSKQDLRLLRNTIYALYGVHFKSDDLSKFFNKQVWYTDNGLTSSQVKLPTHRKKLVEMIIKREK